MKNTFLLLYCFSGVIIITVLLGGTIAKPVFNWLSQASLESIGVKKTAFNSADEKIDEIYFAIDKIQLQVDKIKNIFSSDSIDESKYKKTNHELLARNIYEPIVSVLSFIYRLFFLLNSVLIFLFAVLLNIIYNKMDIKRRIEKLEDEILFLKSSK